MDKKILIALITFLCVISPSNSKNKIDTNKKKQTPPNVIIVITDDQGYGDIAAHGNPLIKTPALDKFYNESVRLTDFHVGPTCAPSRSGLLTGRYANRVGVWHTIGGVSILREKEVTMAQVFKDNGYETGMFGKWHLGDTYPSRPQDKGFKYTVNHGGGGVGQTPDYWGNDYFDDTYFKNGVPTKYKGYCTDIWFNEAINYIEKNKDKPFFCYISTNAPHSPFNVPEPYYNQYKDLNIPEFQKIFYGMITNVDDNFSKLQKKLKKLKISDNTILIFLTDNGTASGYRSVGGKLHGFNAGMKGTKNSEYEGGHRVPFFIRYPDRKIKGGSDIETLTANIDVLPTLASLCNLDLPDLKLDGMDISPLLLHKKTTLERDYVITDSQRLQEPVKWRKSAVMSNKMRLINGKELYDISKDPGQITDLATKHPDVVKKMRGYYNEWWSSVSEEFNQYPVIIVGSDKQNPITITCHDEHISDSKIPWNQNFVRSGNYNPFGGKFTVKFEQSGTYQIEISRWPFESGLEINESVKGRSKTISTNYISKGVSKNYKKGTVKIGAWKETKKILLNAKSVVFKGNFTKGKTNLSAWFTSSENINWGAYYIRITREI